MFRFLLGVITGVVVYWVWQSFGRDLLGMGDYDQGPAYTPPTSGASSYASMEGSSYSSPSFSSTSTSEAASSGMSSASEPQAQESASEQPAATSVEATGKQAKGEGETGSTGRRSSTSTGTP